MWWCGGVGGGGRRGRGGGGSVEARTSSCSTHHPLPTSLRLAGQSQRTGSSHFGVSQLVCGGPDPSGGRSGCPVCRNRMHSLVVMALMCRFEQRWTFWVVRNETGIGVPTLPMDAHRKARGPQVCTSWSSPPPRDPGPFCWYWLTHLIPLDATCEDQVRYSTLTRWWWCVGGKWEWGVVEERM